MHVFIVLCKGKNSVFKEKVVLLWYYSDMRGNDQRRWVDTWRVNSVLSLFFTAWPPPTPLHGCFVDIAAGNLLSSPPRVLKVKKTIKPHKQQYAKKNHHPSVPESPVARLTLSSCRSGFMELVELTKPLLFLARFTVFPILEAWLYLYREWN